MNNYGFTFQDKVFTPEGRQPDVSPAQVADKNRETERQEIEWLKTGPEKVFLYVKHAALEPWQTAVCSVTTWLGTALDKHAELGKRAYTGFGAVRKWTYRRAVTCHIFGVRYVGWYMESTGSYCRLKKAKRQ